jgi:hypothetical protein
MSACNNTNSGSFNGGNWGGNGLNGPVSYGVGGGDSLAPGAGQWNNNQMNLPMADSGDHNSGGRKLSRLSTDDLQKFADDVRHFTPAGGHPLIPGPRMSLPATTSVQTGFPHHGRYHFSASTGTTTYWPRVGARGSYKPPPTVAVPQSDGMDLKRIIASMHVTIHKKGGADPDFDWREVLECPNPGEQYKAYKARCFLLRFPKFLKEVPVAGPEETKKRKALLDAISALKIRHFSYLRFARRSLDLKFCGNFYVDEVSNLLKLLANGGGDWKSSTIRTVRREDQEADKAEDQLERMDALAAAKSKAPPSLPPKPPLLQKVAIAGTGISSGNAGGGSISSGNDSSSSGSSSSSYSTGVPPPPILQGPNRSTNAPSPGNPLPPPLIEPDTEGISVVNDAESSPLAADAEMEEDKEEPPQHAADVGMDVEVSEAKGKPSHSTDPRPVANDNANPTPASTANTNMTPAPAVVVKTSVESESDPVETWNRIQSKVLILIVIRMQTPLSLPA